MPKEWVDISPALRRQRGGGEIVMKPGALSGTLRAAFAICVGLLLLNAIPLSAQVDTGTIVGAVKDTSGAVVGSAKVTLTNEGTGAALSTVTGPDGTYTFSPVRIGTYKLDASSQGFQTVSETHVTVNVGANVVVNFTLKPGSVSETVEVTSAAPVLQTQDASVGQVVDARNINNLPLNGRNFTFLAQVVPGVNSPQADTRGNASTGAFAANGLRPAQNNYMLDGIDNNSDTVDFLNGTNYVVLPPVDAIQEFKVQTSDFSAEFGRSGAAVLNATIKSGTNSFHGSVWEFFRNDHLDAADYFETKKGELRLNQFGFTAGGPVLIPHVLDGRNKVFFFGDYEALRRRQGVPQQSSVPTAAERASGYTNFQDLITGQTGTETDALGRIMPTGTILDPATTRQISPGVFVRDPFMGSTTTCPASAPAGFSYSLAACDLNILPPGRLDPNAVKLLNLYPSPTSSSLFTNFTNSPILREDRQSFDARLDVNFSAKDQMFYRFSLVDDPQFIPSIFGGVADGGGFFQGNQTALAQQSALVWTHTISPTTVNVARAGLNYLHTTRNVPEANNLSNLPAQFGIQGIPQQHENGGLPAFGIQGLQTLGSNAFLPSDEVSSTIQATDDFTKIYGKHTFKMGFEYQHVKFSTLQPPWSRGQFDFNGAYTNPPNASAGSENTGRAQFLLTPIRSTVGGPDFVGGPSDGSGNNSVFVSNISLTDNGKNYYGAYLNDDWKVTSKLTLNLGVRWDYFALVYEHHSNQANFVPSGPPTGSPMYIIPQGPNANNLSPSFTSLLAQDGIALAITNRYGKGLGTSQKTNFAPRFGFAYQANPRLVFRGGFGMFYNGFENRGFSPNLGENYPFQFNFQFAPPSDASPIIYSGCTSPAATPIGSATLETGFSCVPLSPLLVNASGLALRGIQFDYITPYSMSGNFTMQYQLTPSLSFQAGYVTSLGRHLEVFPNSNNVTQLLPKNLPTGESVANFLPFPDFGQGNSYAVTAGNSHYHGLQTKVEKQFASGLNFLAAYTWSKVLSDAHDLLNGGSVGNSASGNVNGYRAPSIPGMGIHADYGLAPFDIRHVFHFSGGYQLPFGKGRRYMNQGGFANAVAGGWSFIWATTLQGGQPITIPCPANTVTGAVCNALLLPGQDPRTGLHIDSNGKLSWFRNPAAWAQPCQLGGVPGAVAPIPGTPTGCIPLNGLAVLGGGPTQVPGPPFHRFDFSTFKDFRFSERFVLQFRAEFFNILNHPNFNAPGFGGNGVVAVSGSTNFTSSNFGEIGSTRDNPYDPRQIQFALKLYY
jgi:Carboxypeptidase regulatory-like domain/TonB dependent receptor/TonB-dependent Receptor Plug Domain